MRYPSCSATYSYLRPVKAGRAAPADSEEVAALAAAGSESQALRPHRRTASAGLLFEIFASHVEQFRDIGVAESGPRGMQNARSEESERVFEDGDVKSVVSCPSRRLESRAFGALR